MNRKRRRHIADRNATHLAQTSGGCIARVRGVRRLLSTCRTRIPHGPLRDQRWPLRATGRLDVLPDRLLASVQSCNAVNRENNAPTTGDLLRCVAEQTEQRSEPTVGSFAKAASAGTDMQPIHELHRIGQSLWLDNITRAMLDDGTLGKLIEDFRITGLTSNPTIFNQAIGESSAYDAMIVEKVRTGTSGEALFMELALEDLGRAADLFLPVYISTGHVDGWVSMEVSPLLARDSVATTVAAARIHAQASRPNLFVKIPGTKEGLAAIEDSIFAGIPINVTLLFSREHYLATADAYMRGLERRFKSGLSLNVPSVASMFVSRWDAAVNDRPLGEPGLQIDTEFALSRYRLSVEAGVDPMIAAATAVTAEHHQPVHPDLPSELPPDLHNHLGIAIAQRTYRAYRELLRSPRWEALANAGALPQRLLWASTGTKDPLASESLYVETLVAPGTINTVPEKTLRAFASNGRLHGPMAENGGNAEAVLSRFAQAGLDLDALAARLQQEGVRSFEKSWTEVLSRIAIKGAAKRQVPAFPLGQGYKPDSIRELRLP